MQITRKKETITLEETVNVDGFDTQLAVQLVLDYEHGGFKVKPNLLSKHGYGEEIRDALDELIDRAFEMGEEKMDEYRGELGLGKQGDLFESAASAAADN